MERDNPHRFPAPLDNRLRLCASFVRDGTRLADVGTDHAYLPVNLACRGKILSAVACDVRKGPLENARANILRFNVEDKVKTLLSDGLDEVDPDDALDIVMAGMGGELIADIIGRTQWLYDESRRLILQPMTRAGTLRSFLCGSGFRIVREKACLSGRKCYSVMLCVYDGKKRPCDHRFEYIGMLGEDPSPEANAYIDMIMSKLRRKINGLRQSGKENEAAYYQDIYNSINKRED